MPRLRTLRVGALEELARQLRFAPAETLRRQLVRAEQLAAEVDPGVNYPEDWVVFRVTGYRPQMEAPAIVVGEALIGDVSALVERLSAAAGVKEAELEAGSYLSTRELCARWGVSAKTLERYRRMGLVARRVAAGGGVSRLAFLKDSVERFERAWKGRIDGAREFSRIGGALEARMVRRGEAYVRLGCSVNQAAARIAGRYGRSKEAVRQVLMRGGVGGSGGAGSEGEGVEEHRGPPSARERGLMARAWWWGIEPGRVAKRLSRSPASVHRVIVDERAARLRRLKLAAGEGVKDLERVLSRPECGMGLGAPGATDLLELVRSAREMPPPEAPAERARLAAYHGLVFRAAGAVAGLSRHGNAARVVDRIETDLRWAARIKAELVRSELALIVRTLESGLGRPLEEVRTAALSRLLLEAIGAAARAVDGFHAGKGGRLAAPVGLGVNRVVAGVAREADGSRARARLGPGVRVVDWTRRVAAWQVSDGYWWLEPPGSVRAGLGVLPSRARRVLELRYGWGGPPRTIEDVAGEVGLPEVRAAAMERRALVMAGRAGAA